MMNDIFQDLIAKGIVVVYLDNILIFTWTVEQHVKAIWKVLEILAKHKLCLCPEKCEFRRNSLNTWGWLCPKTKSQWIYTGLLDYCSAPVQSHVL